MLNLIIVLLVIAAFAAFALVLTALGSIAGLLLLREVALLVRLWKQKC